MESETPIWKWTAALVGVVVACFCLGYFVLGPSARPGGGAVASNIPAAGAAGIITEASPAATPSAPAILIQERTDELEAKRQRAAEEAKKKADEEKKKREEEDAKKKADEEKKKQAEEEAKQLATATPPPAPTPSPDAPTSTENPAANAATPTDTTKTGEEKPTDAKPVDNSANNIAETKTRDLVEPGSAIPIVAPPAPTPAAPRPTPAETLYRVRVGSYPSRDGAKNMAAELSGRGYSATIVSAGGTFKVQVGAFKNQSKAESVQKELQANGYDAAVTP